VNFFEFFLENLALFNICDNHSHYGIVMNDVNCEGTGMKMVKMIAFCHYLGPTLKGTCDVMCIYVEKVTERRLNDVRKLL